MSEFYKCKNLMEVVQELPRCELKVGFCNCSPSWIVSRETRVPEHIKVISQTSKVILQTPKVKIERVKERRYWIEISNVGKYEVYKRLPF
jgi:hypothetical protein